MSLLQVELTDDQVQRLEAAGRQREMTPAEIIQQLIAALPPVSKESRNALDAWRESLGVFDGPDDLSSNPKHMDGFGE